AADLLERSDLAMAWEVLEVVCNDVPEADRVARLVAVARRRHGAVIDDFLAVNDEQRRMRQAIRLHAAERDAELRFFRARLHSVTRREAIYRLVGERFPESTVDPKARVRGWIERLSGVDRIGVDLADPVSRLLVEALLDGGGRREALARLAAAYDPASV